MKSKTTVPCIHELLASPMSGEEIEATSLAIIDSQVRAHGFSSDQWQVVRRMVHAAGDLSIIESVRFSLDATAAGVEALRREGPIYVDSNMIRSGLSLERLRGVNSGYSAGHVHCHVSDEDVAEQAREGGLPRSLFAVRKARPMLSGCIAVFGNAPVALLELSRMVAEEGVRPALIIGMPVGFVHVVESKREMIRLGVPFITLEGHRGGSPLAVSVVHALCSMAGRESRPRHSGEAG